MNILIVEDCEDNQLLFEIFAKDLPYQLTMAEHGKDGLEKFKSESFDLVFLHEGDGKHRFTVK